jgi:RNA polymerase sigma-70 factor (ECF subfamily)
MPASRERFEALLSPILDRAYAMARSLTRNDADAEDLLQEAALRAFRGFDSFEEGTNFRAWFLRILTNAFLSGRRRQKRRPTSVDIGDLSDLYLFRRTEEAGLHQGTHDPARALMQQLSVAAVRRAIEALPDEFRLVASLYFMEDFSYPQIAEVLEIPVGTVRSRLHRGRKMLQKALWSTAVEEGIVRDPADGQVSA